MKLLSDDELDKYTVIALTQDDRDELEEAAKTGLISGNEDDQKEYYRRINYLFELRMKQKITRAQAKLTRDEVMQSLRKQGYHVDHDTSFTSVGECRTLSNKGVTGTWVFIPDDTEVEG